MGSPPVVELAVVELVAVPPPAPVVLLVVELAELLAEELAELLAEELAELLAEELAELLAEELTELLADELAELLAELLVVELVASSPPAPPRPPAPPVPSAPPEPAEPLTAALVTLPPALAEPPVAEPVVPLAVVLLVADTVEPAPAELDDGAPPELAPPPPVLSPSRLAPWAHATSVSSAMAQSAVAPFGHELEALTRLARLPRLPSCGGAPALVDSFPLEPPIRAAPEAVWPSSDAHLTIGRILNTPATARPNPEAERKEVEANSLYGTVWHQQEAGHGNFLPMS
ncbi:hypothetical protein [Sorangium atrum]|uniref:Uncharacterized protein n=1 Tax=Sorangium atrum TaxID=2995308 RepID=A0ABT5C4H6_9BACT|nr:hypothetical protein [Sorangium aterium]MDC0680091.1 hypothetical protein [Sorangium aterium]